jgi:hypothetical protein
MGREQKGEEEREKAHDMSGRQVGHYGDMLSLVSLGKPGDIKE